MDEDECIARKFHATYERLSAEYGYHTRLDTREFDPESPNGRLMIATVREVMMELRRENLHLRQELADAKRWAMSERAAKWDAVSKVR